MMRCRVKALGFVLAAGAVGLGTACAADTEDKFSPEYAECLTDPHSLLHRTEIANRAGTVPLDSDGVLGWRRLARTTDHYPRLDATRPLQDRIHARISDLGPCKPLFCPTM